MDMLTILILTTIPQCVCTSNHHTVDFKYAVAASAAKSLQSCPTLCDPIDSSPPGFSVPGVLQARTLELGCHFLLQ